MRDEVINIVDLLERMLKMYDDPDEKGMSKIEYAFGKEGAKLYLQDLTAAYMVHSKPRWFRKAADIARAQRMANKAIRDAVARVKKEEGFQ